MPARRHIPLVSVGGDHRDHDGYHDDQCQPGRKVHVAGLAEIASTLARSWLVVLPPRNTRARQSDARIALTAGGDTDVGTAAAHGNTYAGQRKIEVHSWQQFHAALKTEAHLFVHVTANARSAQPRITQNRLREVAVLSLRIRTGSVRPNLPVVLHIDCVRPHCVSHDRAPVVKFITPVGRNCKPSLAATGLEGEHQRRSGPLAGSLFLIDGQNASHGWKCGRT